MKNRKRIFYFLECRHGGFWWSHKRKEWFVPFVPEDWGGLASGVDFKTKKKAMQHLKNLPEQGTFILSMAIRRKKGWHFLKEWERIPDKL